MPARYKLLLVEDDENLGFMLKDNLEMAGYQVRLCRDGEKGLTAFHNEMYHICIFDVMLPLKDGFSLATDVRKYNQKIPIIFLTAKSQKDDRIKGFKLGGDDYITKPFSLEEFLLRVEVVLKRVYDRPTTADENHKYFFGHSQFDFNNQIISIDGKSTKLTNKEARLLKILVQHKNQVIERDLIMKTIWEDDGYFVARSMDVFISKLRKYLAPDASVIIKNVHGVGYRLEEK